MKTLIVYFSNYGNTQKIAEAMAQRFELQGQTNLMHVDQVCVSDINHADLIVMGCPTHHLGLPGVMHPLFEILPPHALEGKSFAAFDTSYQTSGLMSYFTAAHRLAAKMAHLGGLQIFPPESFVVAGRVGPLMDGEVEHARAWADRIINAVSEELLPA
ncbi:MAG: flavodoxin family protein [Anaerolineae bacterium]